MSVVYIRLSSKGQVVIPKEIRDELHWQAGTQLALVSTAAGVSLRAIPKKTERSLGDLIGLLKYAGPPISTENLFEPVEYGDDWETQGQADK